MTDRSKDKLTRAVYPLTITDGRKVVAAAATAEALSSTDLVVTYIIITAETDNTGVITVGASTVVGAAGVTRRGIPLNPGDTISLGGVNLKDVYLDCITNGDGCTYLYLA